MIQRKIFLKRFTNSSFVVAFIFAFNAFFLFYLESKLESNLSKYEGQLAVKHSLVFDQEKVSKIQEYGENCKIDFTEGCEKYAADIIRFNNRLKDLVIVFQSQPFKLPSEDPLVKNLDTTKSKIGQSLERLFGLSLNSAIEQGLSTPNQYGKYVANQNSTINSAVAPEIIDGLEDTLSKSINNLESWSENKIYYLPKVEGYLIAVQRLLIIIFTAQILIYILASIADYWLNNIPSPGQNDLDTKYHQRFLFKTRRSKPLFLSLIAGLAGIIISQNILRIETEKTVANNCRRINRNSISINNMLTSNEINNPYIYSELPGYCNILISLDAKSSIDKLKQNPNHDYINSEQIRIYADDFSKLEEKQIDITKNLAFFLILGNVLTISLQLVKLNVENEELD